MNSFKNIEGINLKWKYLYDLAEFPGGTVVNTNEGGVAKASAEAAAKVPAEAAAKVPAEAVAKVPVEAVAKVPADAKTELRNLNCLASSVDGRLFELQCR